MALAQVDHCFELLVRLVAIHVEDVMGEAVEVRLQYIVRKKAVHLPLEARSDG